MRVVRLYVNVALELHNELVLEEATLHYAANVLRLNKKSTLSLFNGDGFDYSCKILSSQNKSLTLKIIEKIVVVNESPLITNLILGISKTAHMDYAIQKCVEAGVTNFFPVFTERTTYKSSEKSDNNKRIHWNKIIISACEQCGRAKLPHLNNIDEFRNIKKLPSSTLGLVLDQNATQSITAFKDVVLPEVWLLVGPEGGLTHVELELANNNGYKSVACGPRVLRTESAAHSALIASQLMWGDLQ